MAPIFRPNDRRPGGPAPPPMPGMGPGQMAPAPPPGMDPGQMAPPIDPAEMQRQAMVAMLEQAEPVPGTVQHYPDGVDTMPRPYFPADSATRRGRRD